ncbi:MAG: hypothetical protein JWQ19_2035 [Subtercola sp.]|nr:hypothetical protein [Subtercola sp.]
MLHYALTVTEFTIADVARELGISRATARMHLLSFHEGGLVLSRRAVQPRGAGTVRYWRARVDMIVAAVDTLGSYFDGVTSGPS